MPPVGACHCGCLLEDEEEDMLCGKCESDADDTAADDDVSTTTSHLKGDVHNSVKADSQSLLIMKNPHWQKMETTIPTPWAGHPCLGQPRVRPSWNLRGVEVKQTAR